MVSKGKSPKKCVTKYQCVLVVDDVHEQALIMAGVLRKAKYQVICVYDGPWALEVAQKRRPALAIVNWLMPGMDGLEVIRRLRADPAAKSMKIILSSANMSGRTTFKQAGADAFLALPFTEDALLRTVASLLPPSISIECR